MTDRTGNIDKILQDVACDLRIPTEVAQMLLRIGGELLRQQQQIIDLTEQLQQVKERHDERFMALNGNVDRLRGVHGA